MKPGIADVNHVNVRPRPTVQERRGALDIHETPTQIAHATSRLCSNESGISPAAASAILESLEARRSGVPLLSRHRFTVLSDWVFEWQPGYEKTEVPALSSKVR
jgi:hypothetical protein